MISFVATVGGNLTITGSAANIIVAEKCHKIAPSCKFDFFRHYKVGNILVYIFIYIEREIERVLFNIQILAIFF